MTGLLAFSVIGVAAALIRGGSLTSWSHVQVRWWPLALTSLAVQLILHNPPIDRQPWALAFGPLIWMACLTALVAVLVRNALGATTRAARLAWSVAALGVGLNLLVVGANDGFMPQSAAARTVTRGTAITQTPETRLRNVVPMSDDTRLNALGDLIPEPAWLPKTNVISIGDVLLGAGLAVWAFASTARRDRHSRLLDEARTPDSFPTAA